MTAATRTAAAAIRYDTTARGRLLAACPDVAAATHAVLTSRADANRSAGLAARQRAITAPWSGGNARSARGSVVSTAFMVSTAEAPLKARSPASISYSTAPNAKMSERASASSPRTCSGDM